MYTVTYNSGIETSFSTGENLLEAFNNLKISKQKALKAVFNVTCEKDGKKREKSVLFNRKKIHFFIKSEDFRRTWAKILTEYFK